MRQHPHAAGNPIAMGADVPDIRVPTPKRLGDKLQALTGVRGLRVDELKQIRDLSGVVGTRRSERMGLRGHVRDSLHDSLRMGLVVENLEDAQELRNPQQIPHTFLCTEQRESATGVLKPDERGGQLSETGAVDIVAGREVDEDFPFPGRELLPDLLPQSSHALLERQPSGDIEDHDRVDSARLSHPLQPA